MTRKSAHLQGFCNLLNALAKYRAAFARRRGRGSTPLGSTSEASAKRESEGSDCRARGIVQQPYSKAAAPYEGRSRIGGATLKPLDRATVEALVAGKLRG
jgi:hypothetical protein